MRRLRRLLLVVVVASCSRGPDSVRLESEQALAGALLPQHRGRVPQNEARLAPGDPADVRALADVATCERCHADAVHTWRSSAHARSSFDNPWYRQAFNAFRETRSAEEARFCSGCHDPLPLVAGSADPRPDDPLAHAGVTCAVCHGIQEVTSDGNASYVLRTDSIFIPDIRDRSSVARHVASVTPAPLRTAQLCGSCHRGFLGPHMGNQAFLPGIDEPTFWQRSGYAASRASRIDEPVAERTCQGCHMPEDAAPLGDLARDEHGRFRSHRFPGAHVSLAQATGDSDQLRAQRELLGSAAIVDVAAVRARGTQWAPADRAEVRGGDAIEIDVVVRNTGTGHRFPGGTRDTQDTWIEVEVLDAQGVRVAQSGVEHDRASDDAHVLTALLIDREGDPDYRHHVQNFEVAAYDQTIATRDAIVERYALELPSHPRFPLQVRARLRHRRHNLILHEAACADQQTAEGRAFSAAARRLGHSVIDTCQPQPLTDLAQTEAWIGPGSETHEIASHTPAWRRLFDHALAQIGDVQEHLDAARPSLEAGLRLAPDARAQAMFYAQLARLEGRQGRLTEALAAAQQAQERVGASPAIDRFRGDAFAQVWRWSEAAAAYRTAAEAAPGDDLLWASLARACGSVGDDSGTLRAAATGLALQPRDESLLRSQCVVLAAEHAPDAELARTAFTAFRINDRLSELRLECGRRHPSCAIERVPAHVHPLHPTTPAN